MKDRFCRIIAISTLALAGGIWTVPAAANPEFGSEQDPSTHDARLIAAIKHAHHVVSSGRARLTPDTGTIDHAAAIPFRDEIGTIYVIPHTLGCSTVLDARRPSLGTPTSGPMPRLIGSVRVARPGCNDPIYFDASMLRDGAWVWTEVAATRNRRVAGGGSLVVTFNLQCESHASVRYRTSILPLTGVTFPHQSDAVSLNCGVSPL